MGYFIDVIDGSSFDAVLVTMIDFMKKMPRLRKL
jgi:hypothetical protein